MTTPQTSGYDEFILPFLREHKHEFNHELVSELEKLEDQIQRIFKVKYTLESRVEKLFPFLFSIRLLGLERLSKEGRSISEIPDETMKLFEPSKKNTSKKKEDLINPILKKLAINLNNAFVWNRKLVETLEVNKLDSTNYDEYFSKKSGLNYEQFLIFIQLLPRGVSEMVFKVFINSLNISFLMLVYLMIEEGDLHPNQKKIQELLTFSDSVSSDYCIYMEWMLRKGLNSLLEKEHSSWLQLSSNAFEKAFSDNEPDISSLVLVEKNPYFKP